LTPTPDEVIEEEPEDSEGKLDKAEEEMRPKSQESKSEP
jgi:hypothetical protein